MKTALLHLVLLAGLSTLPAMELPDEPIPGPGGIRTIYPRARPLLPPAGIGAVPPAPSKSLLPSAALEVVTQHDKETAEIRKEARVKLGAFRRRLALSLKDLQERYTREAKLDQAVAIRDCLRTLGDVDPQARPDPGTLTLYSGYVDRVGFFRVTGANTGSLWGTDVYTTDSSLAAATVHSGALKMGETGLVKVTILPGCASYEGSTRHGITSSSWGNYTASYQVEPVGPEDEKDIEGQSDLPVLPSAGPAPGNWPNAPVALSTAGLPDEARQLVARFQAESATIQQEAEQKLRRLRREIIVELKPLMTNYARAVKLDEAVAIRDYIRGLSELTSKVLPDPGALYNLPQSRGILYFRVTGRNGGPIWGTDVYTIDSNLATAAVHAGAVKEGETGVVKVTLLPGQDSYEGTIRNGITSNSYGPYSGSYKVEASEEEDLPER